jgi:hypothetical protein
MQNTRGTIGGPGGTVSVDTWSNAEVDAIILHAANVVERLDDLAVHLQNTQMVILALLAGVFALVGYQAIGRMLPSPRDLTGD